MQKLSHKFITIILKNNKLPDSLIGVRFFVSKHSYLSLTFERTGDTVSENIKDKVLELKNKGFSYKAISDQLGIPVSTAKTYLRREKSAEGNTCKHCGAELINVKGKKNKKFCSDKCRMAWWYKNQHMMNKKSAYEVVCVCCKKKFNFYGYKNRKYCSRECYLRDKYGKE